MSHLNETDDRLRGCGEKREKKIKRQGRERTSRREESALGRGNRNTMSYRLFFFLPYPETCRTSTTRNHTWHLHWKPSLNHWATEEVPTPHRLLRTHIDTCAYTHIDLREKGRLSKEDRFRASKVISFPPNYRYKWE